MRKLKHFSIMFLALTVALTLTATACTPKLFCIAKNIN